MRVKVCGINSYDDIKACLNAGVDALGFLVGITHVAEDKVDLPTAKELIQLLPPFVSSVVVTHLTEVDEIINMMNYLKANILQLHDYIEPSLVKKIRSKLPWVKIIKAIHVTSEEAIDLAKKFDNVCDGLLLDSRTMDRLGGTGKTHDWQISRRIVEVVSIPVILAGGLNPDNVREAIIKVKPFAVDVNSGVETEGKKDYQKVKKFVMEAKSAIAGIY